MVNERCTVASTNISTKNWSYNIHCTPHVLHVGSLTVSHGCTSTPETPSEPHIFCQEGGTPPAQCPWGPHLGTPAPGALLGFLCVPPPTVPSWERPTHWVTTGSLVQVHVRAGPVRMPTSVWLSSAGIWLTQSHPPPVDAPHPQSLQGGKQPPLLLRVSPVSNLGIPLCGTIHGLQPHFWDHSFLLFFLQWCTFGCYVLHMRKNLTYHECWRDRVPSDSL